MHYSQLLYVSYIIPLYYSYYIYITCILFSVQAKISHHSDSFTIEVVFEICGFLIFVKINHGQSFIVVKAYYFHLSIVLLAIHNSSLSIFKVMEDLIRINLRLSKGRAGAGYCML